MTLLPLRPWRAVRGTHHKATNSYYAVTIFDGPHQIAEVRGMTQEEAERIARIIIDAVNDREKP